MRVMIFVIALLVSNVTFSLPFPDSVSFVEPNETCSSNSTAPSMAHEGRALECADMAVESWEGWFGGIGGNTFSRCIWSNCYHSPDPEIPRRFNTHCQIIQNPNAAECTSGRMGEWSNVTWASYDQACSELNYDDEVAFYSAPELRCIERCEYVCSGAAGGGGSCSPDPDVPWVADYQPTGEVCAVEDHDCEQIGPGVYDCRDSRDLGDQDCQDEEGNPCNPLTGNKSYSVVDFSADGLEFQRTYHSTQHRLLHSHLGRGWSHTYASYISPDGANQLNLVTSTGRFHPFISEGGARYLSTLSGDLAIDETPTHWILKQGGVRHIFDRSTGFLVEIRRLEDAGRSIAIQHDEQGRVAIVENAKGRSLTFSYQNGRLDSLTTPDGTISFAYEINSYGEPELVSTQYPDASTEEYEYRSELSSSLLTRVIDATGAAKGIYTYDSEGRVTGSKPSDDIEGVTLHYSESGETTVVRPLGEEVVYEAVSAQGWHGAVTGSRTGTYSKTIEYADHTHFRPSRIVRNGQVTTYQYDSAFREVLRTEAHGTGQERETEQTWRDPHFRLQSRTVDVSEVEYQYSSEGRRIAEVQRDLASGEARTSRREYCDTVDPGQGCPLVGLLREEVSPSGAVTQYHYYLSDASDGSHHAGDLWKITNPMGHFTEFGSYDAAGRPESVVDPNGVETSMTYDLQGRLLALSVAGSSTTYQYFSNGLVSRVTQPDGNVLHFEYDGADRISAIEGAVGERIEYDFDAAGNPITEARYDTQGVLTYELQRLYDQVSRLESLLVGTGHQTTYQYDAAGNLSRMKDALDNATDHEYDALDRRVSTLDAESGEAIFEYDSRDNLVRVTDQEGLSTLYTYNGFDELLLLDSPDTGVTSYAYDADGNRVSRTDARGITATFTYDSLGRLTGKSFPDSSLDVTFEYDLADSETGCSASFPVGRLTRMTDRSGSTIYCYDSRGNVTRKRHVANLDIVSVEYVHNDAGALTGITYPSGNEVVYHRDGSGRVSSIELVPSDGGQSEDLVYGVEYLSFGAVEQYSFGNRQTVNRSYDLAYQVTSVVSPAIDLEFRRDPVGNIERLKAPGFERLPIESYRYDNLYRLESVEEGQGIAVESYAYDHVGNRLSKTTSSGTEPYGYVQGSHRLTAVDGVPRSYDAAGNLVSEAKGARSFAYGDHNRMKSFADSSGVVNYI